MAVDQIITDFRDPYLGITWGELGAVGSVVTAADRVAAVVTLGYPAEGIRDALESELTALAEMPLGLDLRFESPALSAGRAVREVRNIVAVASGKGGVGKSTTAVNLALALAKEGAKVGILDADVYGPSLGIMLGIPPGRRPQVRDEKLFLPIKAHGIEAMSMSFLVTRETPMVWRGPMASGALNQMLNQTVWGGLDYLIVDMPPGTGDIQLTLSQQAAVAGAVIVTTPQDLALQDAIKGIEMFRKVDVPVLGIIENMAMYRCPECGHESHIFGAGGGERTAQQYGVPLLATLPLSPTIRAQTDSGVPTIVADPDGDDSRAYRRAARSLAARLWQIARSTGTPPEIAVSDD